MRKYDIVAGCIVALAAIAATPLVATGETKSSNELISFPQRPFIENGLKRESVVLMLGQPSAKLSPDIWVYFDFPPRDFRETGVHIERPQTVDTALVIFENDRVIHIRLCDSKPVRAFLAKLERRAPVEPLIAVRQSPALRRSSRTP